MRQAARGRCVSFILAVIELYTAASDKQEIQNWHFSMLEKAGAKKMVDFCNVFSDDLPMLDFLNGEECAQKLRVDYSAGIRYHRFERNILNIAMVNKLYDLAVMQPDVPVSIKEHYLSLEHHANACIGCRSCESRCPFGVKVADRMIQTAGLFS